MIYREYRILTYEGRLVYPPYKVLFDQVPHTIFYYHLLNYP